MILVTGATGTTGRAVAKALVDEGHRPRLFVRKAEKVKEFAGKVDLALGDYDDPKALAAAMAGVDKVYLVTTGLNGVEQGLKAIAAAKQAGVRHVVKLSVAGADKPQLALARWHAVTEQALIESGMAWTMLRPGNFMTNAFGWAPTIKAQGKVFQPSGNGRYASIDPQDIAEVAAKILTTHGHEGVGYTLTGPEALSGAEHVAKISAAIGKPLEFVDVPAEAARASMLKGGMPAPFVDAMIELMTLLKDGYADFVSPDVKKILSRHPTSFDAWLARNAAAFKG